MRISTSCIAFLCLAGSLALASPVAKKLEKKSISNHLASKSIDSELDSKTIGDEAILGAEDGGAKHNRAKKQASTTFCVEVRHNKPVQVECNPNISGQQMVIPQQVYMQPQPQQVYVQPAPQQVFVQPTAPPTPEPTTEPPTTTQAPTPAPTPPAPQVIVLPPQPAPRPPPQQQIIYQQPQPAPPPQQQIIYQHPQPAPAPQQIIVPQPQYVQPAPQPKPMYIPPPSPPRPIVVPQPAPQPKPFLLPQSPPLPAPRPQFIMPAPQPKPMVIQPPPPQQVIYQQPAIPQPPPQQIIYQQPAIPQPPPQQVIYQQPQPEPCQPEIKAYTYQPPPQVQYAVTGNCATHGQVPQIQTGGVLPQAPVSYGQPVGQHPGPHGIHCTCNTLQPLMSALGRDAATVDANNQAIAQKFLNDIAANNLGHHGHQHQPFSAPAYGNGVIVQPNAGYMMTPMAAGNLGDSFYQGPMNHGFRFGRDDEEKKSESMPLLEAQSEDMTLSPTEDSTEIPVVIPETINSEEKPRVARFLMNENDDSVNSVDDQESK